MRNLLTALVITGLLASCNQKTKVVTTECPTPSSQALCVELLVSACDVIVRCGVVESTRAECELESLEVCAGFDNIDPSKANLVYSQCLPALEQMSCDTVNDGFPWECESLFKDRQDAGPSN